MIAGLGVSLATLVPCSPGATSTGVALGEDRQVAQDHLLLAVDRHPLVGDAGLGRACDW